MAIDWIVKIWWADGHFRSIKFSNSDLAAKKAIELFHQDDGSIKTINLCKKVTTEECIFQLRDE
jgi:hypothetical protein